MTPLSFLLKYFLLLFCSLLLLHTDSPCRDLGTSETIILKPDTLFPNDSEAIKIKRKDRPWKYDYTLNDGRRMVYSKVKPFEFITDLPKDFMNFGKYSFRKKSLPWLAVIAVSTGILIKYDQQITDGAQNLCDRNNFARKSSYHDIFAPTITNQPVSIISAPKNLNTVFYTLGQGYPALILGGGLLYYGLRNHDIGAVSTASQLAEAFIAMGFTTQVVKRITGRETPLEATAPGGKWDPFPAFTDYQKHTPKYDAFPSGHLATAICAVTILAENYPDKKWIKPVGYALSTLIAWSMVNNGVHWTSDYPLAIGIGYAFGKVISMKSRTFEFTP